MKEKIQKNLTRKIIPYCLAGLFAALICSLGITFALGANQMEITGQAYFVASVTTNPDRLPIFPVVNNDGNYFNTSASGQQQIFIINQAYVDGDYYLSLCTANSNNGNTSWSVNFSLMNPTSYVWTNGAASFAAWPAGSGGLANVNFTFNSASVTPTTLTTNQTATVVLNMTSQLGKTDTQGAAIVTVKYTFNGATLDTRIFFKYYSRNAGECPL